MTTEDHDPVIQNLFDEVDVDLDGRAFAAQVARHARTRKIRFGAGWTAIGLALLATASLLAAPLADLAQLLSIGLTASVVDLGKGQLALILSPVNTIGTLLILSVTGVRLSLRKIALGTYA